MADLMDLDLDLEEEAPHRAALAASSIEALAQGAPGLFRLLENLRPEGVDLKHRRLRLGNAALRERVFGPLPGALDLLCALGYVPTEEEGETFLCLDLARRCPAAVEREALWLQALIDRRWRPQPWQCPACTLQNAVESAACAVCEGPRPAWAAPPALPRPRLAAAAEAPPRTAGAATEEQRHRSEGLQRARGERQRERDRILAEARADRQRFDDVAVGQAPTAAAEPAPAVAGPPAAAAEAAAAVRQRPSSAALRVRLPHGGVLEQTFQAAAPLSRVFDLVDGLLVAHGELAEDYALLQAIPRRVFLREVLGGRSLAELGLAPSSTLSVLRNEDRGRVQSGGVETALLTGDIDGLSYDELQELQSRMGDVGKRARRASPQTREACTRVHAYRGSSTTAAAGGQEEERQCAICLVGFEDGTMLRTLWCGHGFHQLCVDRWLAEKDECPVCRVAPPVLTDGR